MFEFFKPKVVVELYRAKSRISISFNGQGSEREKISIVSVVVHFINDKYKAVTRLISLPSLPNYSKTSVGKDAKT